ncbi:MAG: phosphatidate cytidylyltransferase [Planctomycetales bacterium]|nr:phosphatidate cytidylyltransferase [Planctomycetales bacterium]
MLSWRLILGVLLVSVVVGLAWLDYYSPTPGLWLSPLAFLGAFLGAGELVRLFESNAKLYDPADADGKPRHITPSRYVVATGAMLTVVVSFMPLFWHSPGASVARAGWTAIGFALSLLMAIVVEMIRYQQPGVATIRLSQAVLAIAYSGALMGFVVQLRLLSGGPWGDEGRWGLVALLSLIAITKCNDTGAYFTGRLIGRHKMTPILSPGKTWEGAAGGLALGIVAGFIVLGPVAQRCGCHTEMTPGRWAIGVVAYSAAMVAAAIAGDLAISLLKRDAGLKNSSSWLPGFGGVLDLLDSIVFAAPIAYVLWIARVVGP